MTKQTLSGEISSSVGSTAFILLSPYCELGDSAASPAPQPWTGRRWDSCPIRAAQGCSIEWQYRLTNRRGRGSMSLRQVNGGEFTA
jgi:hypothetical protein